MTPLQRTIVERALALARELEATAGSAPHGQVIDRCESLLLGAGRDFLRIALEVTLQDRVEALGKGTPVRSCPCGVTGRNKGRSSRSMMTALGRSESLRSYFACPGCGRGGAHVAWTTS